MTDPESIAGHPAQLEPTAEAVEPDEAPADLGEPPMADPFLRGPSTSSPAKTAAPSPVICPASCGTPPRIGNNPALILPGQQLTIPAA